TAGPIGGPPDALPPVTRAFTTTFPFSLMLFPCFYIVNFDLKKTLRIKNAKSNNKSSFNIYIILKPL
ncbi:MAG: hypothetical protein ACXACO_21940, partial [Promethearchaeota archaeon]